jgi:hypothetical protein
MAPKTAKLLAEVRKLAPGELSAGAPLLLQ